MSLLALPSTNPAEMVAQNGNGKAIPQKQINW
jgi:hypothetical protein